MKGFEEPAIVFGLASATRQAGPKHRQRMRPIILVHSRRHGFWSPTQSEAYESCLIPRGNPNATFNRQFVHTA
jgi:hypothetical protein